MVIERYTGLPVLIFQSEHCTEDSWRFCKVMGLPFGNWKKSIVRTNWKSRIETEIVSEP